MGDNLKKIDEDVGDRPNPYVKDDRLTRKTQAYSFVDSERVGIKAVEIKDVISGFIEKHIEPWKALPQSVRDLIIKSPNQFTFTYATSKDYPPTITFKGVTFRWMVNGYVWSLSTIEE